MYPRLLLMVPFVLFLLPFSQSDIYPSLPFFGLLVVGSTAVYRILRKDIIIKMASKLMAPQPATNVEEEFFAVYSD